MTSAWLGNSSVWKFQ